MSYSEINQLITRTGEKLRLSQDLILQVATPNRIIEVNFPVKMDSGEVKTFKGYRVQHNDACGPYKG